MSQLTTIVFDEVKPRRVTRADMLDYQVTRSVLGPDGSHSSSFAADWVTVPPGWAHLMHRHPDADQFVLPLDGTLTIASPAEVLTVQPRQLAVVPRGIWHEVRNETNDEVTSIVMFGAPSYAEAGYEEYDPDARGTTCWTSST